MYVDKMPSLSINGSTTCKVNFQNQKMEKSQRVVSRSSGLQLSHKRSTRCSQRVVSRSSGLQLSHKRSTRCSHGRQVSSCRTNVALVAASRYHCGARMRAAMHGLASERASGFVCGQALGSWLSLTRVLGSGRTSPCLLCSELHQAG
jgi:hypothetical protein